MLFKPASLLGLLAVMTAMVAAMPSSLEARDVVCISGNSCRESLYFDLLSMIPFNAPSIDCGGNAGGDSAKVCNCHPDGTFCSKR